MKPKFPTVFLSALACFIGGQALAETSAEVDTSIVATFETGTFLESIAVRPDGVMLVVDHTTHAVLAVSPDGGTQELVELPASAAGVALGLDQTILVTSGYSEDGASVYVLSPEGEIEANIPGPGSIL